ncbi:MAG TPA: hypothetical protein VEB19_08105 [Gemmatimonadaceae bacterium]|nr:hypothetical protein [Gemmatimonadaceae bacterium]
MKHGTALAVTSVISIVLLILHLSGDVIYGMDTAGPGMLFAIAVLVLLLYAALALRDRKSGYIILFLGALAAIGMPVLHMAIFTLRPTFAQRPGAFFFIATLLALGVSGGVAAILAIQGLVSLRRARS